MSAVDDYFASLDPSARAAFERVRRIATEVAAEAEPGQSYGMAALLYRARPLLGFRAARNHLSVFPFSPSAVDAVRDRLAATAVSKGTIRFTSGEPLADDVVRELVRCRMAEIAAASN